MTSRLRVLKALVKSSFTRNLISVHPFDKPARRVDRHLAAAGHPYTQLEWSEVRRKPSHCILVGALGRQPSPDVAHCYRPQAPRVFVEGNHVASEQYLSDLGGGTRLAGAGSQNRSRPQQAAALAHYDEPGPTGAQV